MESKANYTIVGIFVLLLSAGVIFFALWLGKYGFKNEYDYYKVYTKDSVSGLSVNAAVKYKGVDVGTVSKIRINPKNIKEIEILLQVKKGTPITEGMYAELKYFGLTGLAYIELAGGSKDAPLLKKKEGEIPVIKEKPSLYNRLDTTLTDMTAKVTVALDKIDKLLSDQNIKNMSKTIENTMEITENIKKSNPEITKAIKNFVEIEENINILTKNLSDTSLKIASSSDAFTDMTNSIKKVTKEEINNLVKQINEASKKANDLINDIITQVKSGDYNLKKISSPTISQINQAIRELKMLLKTSQETIEELERSPSDLLYKKESPLLGPGEKLK